MAIVIWPVTKPISFLTQLFQYFMPRKCTETEEITEEAIQKLNVDQTLQKLQEQFNEVSGYVIVVTIVCACVSVSV